MKFIPDTEKAESSDGEPIGMSEEEEGWASDEEQEDNQQEAGESISPIPVFCHIVCLLIKSDYV